MNSVRTEQISLDEIFPSGFPSTIGPLLFALEQLNGRDGTTLQASIRIIYNAYMKEVPDGLRRQVLRYLVREVETGILTPRAILAVARFDSNHSLVNNAVAAYLRLKTTGFRNPFEAVQNVLDLILGGGVANRGAMFAGLVCFGDRRVCALARSIRGVIPPEDVRAFSLAVDGPLQRSTIEFCVEWLVELMRHNEFENAMQVAYALTSMVTSAPALMVQDVEHNFGPYGFSIAKRYPETTFAELLDDLAHIIANLAEGRLPALRRMIEILREPKDDSLDRLDQRKLSTRRANPDRRVSERRIVDIVPRIERRSSQRRDSERRVGQRR